MWKAAGLIVFLVCVQLAVTNGQQQQSSRFLNPNFEASNEGAEGGSGGRRIDACKTKSGLAPHPEYCDEYFECINGQEVLRECPNGLVFVGQGHGIVAGNCHYPFVGDCQGRPKRLAGQQRGGFEDDPCKKRLRLSFDKEHCDRYWECIDDQAVQFDCPNGLVFSGRRRGGVVGGCDYKWRTGTCEESGRTQANQPIQTEHCDWLYGIFGHETSCTRYWTCWNGTSTEQFCIGGLLYNEKTRSCDWPENVEGCQKHPLCKDFPNGNVALGKSCNRYWHCQGGYPRLQRCPAMLVFDKNSLRCVVPPTEDCEVPSTTTEAAQFAEDEENEDIGNNNGVQQQQQPQSNNRGNARPQQSQGGGRPIPIGAPIPVGAQRFNQQQAQPLSQFSGLPQLPGGAIPLGNIQQQQQPQQRNRFQQ